MSEEDERDKHRLILKRTNDNSHLEEFDQESKSINSEHSSLKDIKESDDEQSMSLSSHESKEMLIEESPTILRKQ